MKLIIYLTSILAGTIFAFPGMNNLMKELAKRQASGVPAPEMIGDLVQGATTLVGNQVKNCLLGTGTCQDLTPKMYKAPALLSLSCLQDTCCVWDYISKDLVQMFTNSDGTCNDAARSAVHLGFHDAGAWSKTSGSGGADGSLVLSLDEINRSENNGMQDIRLKAIALLAKYASWGVGAADLVQYMHNVATVFHKQSERLLPDTNSPANQLIDLFVAKTINFKDLIALIGAHTTAKQRFVDPSKAGQSLDSTPGVWDVKFYSEVMTPSPPSGVFRLPSDEAFVNNAETNPGFGVFSNPTNGQAIWNAATLRHTSAFLSFG